MNKTIVNIELISGCFPKLNIAKSGFYNFESGAFNHSATLPAAGFIEKSLAIYFILCRNDYARIGVRGKLI